MSILNLGYEDGSASTSLENLAAAHEIVDEVVAALCSSFSAQRINAMHDMVVISFQDFTALRWEA